MALPDLYNIPDSSETFSQFSFANMDSHRIVVAAIQRKSGIFLPIYVIDPIPMNAIADWAYNHQAMHNSVNDLLGVQGNDLTDVDFSKPEQVSAWITLHANEHVQWHNQLRV